MVGLSWSHALYIVQHGMCTETIWDHHGHKKGWRICHVEASPSVAFPPVREWVRFLWSLYHPPWGWRDQSGALHLGLGVLLCVLYVPQRLYQVYILYHTYNYIIQDTHTHREISMAHIQNASDTRSEYTVPKPKPLLVDLLDMFEELGVREHHTSCGLLLPPLVRQLHHRCEPIRFDLPRGIVHCGASDRKRGILLDLWQSVIR